MAGKQEQRPAEPGVAEVGPGVLRIQLPIRFTGLGHVNMYVLEDRAGAAVIDPGLPGRTSWKAIETGLAEASIPVRRVHSIFVTHSHPDHFGGVARLAAASGAAMVTHAAYRAWWHRHRHGGVESLPPDQQAIEALARKGRNPWDDPAGRRGMRSRLRSMGPKALALGAVRTPEPDRRVRHAERLQLADREWQAIHTPGHTGDHLCLWDPEHGLVVTGDHVLPTITPHVSAIGSGDDPLATYLRSLRLVADLPGVMRALPAHGEAFDDLGGRVKSIVDHHDRRIEQILAIGDRPRTTRDYARALYPERLWGYLAESETYAHLVHLATTGRARRLDGDGAPRFVTSD